MKKLNLTHTGIAALFLTTLITQPAAWAHEQPGKTCDGNKECKSHCDKHGKKCKCSDCEHHKKTHTKTKTETPEAKTTPES